VIGQSISHYRITEKLGEGGMGVVYKAEDTKLDRPVALKFLAAHLVSDSDIRKRFEREAKAAAALNHPNICHVYSIDGIEGKTFIAMAFLEGEGLDKKIESGPLKLKDALDFAIQTAKGLQAAHGKGIVHRDIKPANLMIGEDGHVTIMDFGLAQLADRSKLTRLDETMGTVTYMSPEQTYGMDLDHRTDVWSLGVVIYETVTGQQPFKGHYDKAVMYSITNEEYEPITALRAGVPMELELLVNKALAKEADRRYQSTADMVVDLESLSEKLKSGKSTIVQAASPPGTQAIPTQAEHPLVKYRVIESLEKKNDSVIYRAEDTQRRQSVTVRVVPEVLADEQERRRRLRQSALVSLSVVTTLAAIVFALLWLRQPEPEPPLLRFSFTPERLNSQSRGKKAVISPNGRYVAFATPGSGKLWLHDLESDTAEPLEGTVGGRRPFWSPDSEFIGFATAQEGEVKKIAVNGGPAIPLCEVPTNLGGTWSPDGNTIVFAGSGRLYEVPSRGGTPRFLEWSDPKQLGLEGRAVYPTYLQTSTSNTILAFAVGSGRQQQMVIRDMVSGQTEVLGAGAYPVYSATGHILYQTAPLEAGLWALPFDVQTLKPTGEAFPVAQQAANPSVSDDGMLAYVDSAGQGLWQITERDRKGNRRRNIGEPQALIGQPALSPQETEIAVTGTEEGNQDIWIHSIPEGSKRRLTFAPETDNTPTWSPSGTEIAFGSSRSGSSGIFRKSADGTSEATLITDTGNFPDWSPDATHLVYNIPDARSTNISYCQLRNGDRVCDPVSFLKTSFREIYPKFSPNSRYVAYVADDTGRNEVYVRTFPEGVGPFQVSTEGGTQARWSRNGKELYFVQESTLMSAAVTFTERGFSRRSPIPLFELGALFSVGVQTKYDVSRDGQRFYVVEPQRSEIDQAPSIHLVQNWYEQFRDREQD
jgi:serine/threonine protein kinase